ncbi:tRNA (mnm(5)s(2)U34)-methyltransferase [Paraliobacillus ryukyuensis]|uniref:tRNA (mnm(5)s(2)U34)-methyltransferase n=1 Tax=Paraliobacillus ryukyuensis TaxID=200904 RepID=UPI0009A6BF95|nr:class I SAM-dependent methyltransferase [Paraliobacillus ryukyuensis]
MLKPVIPFAHELLEQVIKPGDLAVDATCGNGNDTLFLSQVTGQAGKVLAFDVQEQAIEETKNKLAQHNQTNVELHLDGHENIDNYLQKEQQGQVAGAIFNLGYLPKSDKTIITKAATTIEAVSILAANLKPGGRIVLVVYHGHPGGAEEKDALYDHLTTLDQAHYRVLQYGFINQINQPPFILAIEKK